MKKFIKFIPIVIAIVLVAVLTLWQQFDKKVTYVANLQMEADAMAVVDYYYPLQIKLTDKPVELNLRLPVLKSSPRFGYIKLGNSADSLISVVLAAPPDADDLMLYVDKNNNEDLRDDGEPAWDEINQAYLLKEVLVEVTYVENGELHVIPYPVTFYRYKNKLQDVLVGYRNGYRKGFITLGDSSYKIAIFDDDLDGLFHQLDKGALVIDRNRDGVLEGAADSDEYLLLSGRFNAGGQTFMVKDVAPSGRRITIVPADSLIYSKRELDVESRAPAFRTETITGDIIDLADYRDKVVLLDFWATWCKPWQNNLATLKKSYSRYHNQGFEIIGLNLDYDRRLLDEFLKAHNIQWPQISNGRGWEMPMIEIYRVRSIPKSFLLDRRGFIRYKNLQFQDLKSKIYELLNEPGGSD